MYLNKKGFVFEFKPGNFRIDKEKMKKLVNIGLPSSIQKLVIGVSFLAMTVVANQFGVEASAAMGIMSKFNGFAMLPAIAMSSSVSSIVAQNLGAGYIDRAKKTMRMGILLTLPISILFASIVFFMPEMVIRMFSSDPAVIAKGVEYMRFIGIDYLVIAVVFCINGLLMGSGVTKFIMFNSIFSSIILRTPLAHLFGIVFGMGLAGVGLTAPIASFGGCVVSFIYYKTGLWSKKKLI